MGWILTVLLGLTGGSFAGVVIYRWPREQSVVWPRSYCEHCHHTLNLVDLLPLVSYVRMRGKCRYCHHAVSKFYPFIESLMVLIFMLLYYYRHFDRGWLWGMIFAWGLTVAAFIDLKTGYIPDFISLGGCALGLLKAGCESQFPEALFAMLGLGGFYLALWWISRGGMGLGDVKLAAAIGAFTGPTGSLTALFISSLLGGIVAVFLILSGRGDLKTEIPFAPFLALGGYFAYLNLMSGWF